MGKDEILNAKFDLDFVSGICLFELEERKCHYLQKGQERRSGEL